MAGDVRIWRTNRMKHYITVMLSALACILLIQVYQPTQALALMNKKQKKAYNRCVNAIYDYENRPTTFKVDLSDLGLSKSKVSEVLEYLNINGELFWVNTIDATVKKKSLTFTCYYSDSKITKMRAEVDAAVEKAYTWIGPSMSDATKVHMLHDWLLKHTTYVSKQKTAYTSLVEGEGDCFGFARGMDVLLRRAGFTTSMALNDSIDHSWNLVKIGSHWYHVDVTWDQGYTYNKNLFWYPKNVICHRFLLQSDEAFDSDTHTGWTADYACTDSRYYTAAFVEGSFIKECSAYKKIVRTFTKNGIKYTVTGVSKVKVSGLAKSKKSKTTITIPKTIKYKKVTYKIVGIKKSAFASSKCKKLIIKSPYLTKSGVKKSLLKSKIKTINVPSKKYKTYKKYFKKSNSGKAVKVTK